MRVSGSKITAKLICDYSITKSGVSVSIEATKPLQYTGKEDSWSSGRYSNNVNITRELTVANATLDTKYEVKVSGETEKNYDFFYLKDDNLVEIKKYTGVINDTFIYTGKTLIANLSSDRSIRKDGVTVTIKELQSENNTTQPGDNNTTGSGDLNGTTSMLSVFAGSLQAGYAGDGGPATQALLSDPFGVTVDGSGNIYIADLLNSAIRKVDTNGTITSIGEGIVDPHGVIATHDGTVYVCNTNANQIVKITPEGQTVLVAGNGNAGDSGDNGDARLASIYGPHAITLDANEEVWFTDTFNNKIKHIDASGSIETVYIGLSLNFPLGIAVDTQNGVIYIADSGNGRILKRDLNTSTTSTMYLDRNVVMPANIRLDGAGNLLVADMEGYQVFSINLHTQNSIYETQTIAGTGEFGYSDAVNPIEAKFSNVADVAFEPNTNSIYIADPMNHMIRKITQN